MQTGGIRCQKYMLNKGTKDILHDLCAYEQIIDIFI